jgi:hypothetical protein
VCPAQKAEEITFKENHKKSLERAISFSLEWIVLQVTEDLKAKYTGQAVLGNRIRLLRFSRFCSPNRAKANTTSTTVVRMSRCYRFAGEFSA